MPNWCQNHLTVTGATPEFRAWLTDHSFSFEKMNPLPKPQTTNNADPNGWAMINRCCSAWGTKWDLADHEQQEVAYELLDHGSAFFDTAWSPPMQALEALSRKFPEVLFQLHYCELGMFFAGTAIFHDGECHDDFHEEQATVMGIACDIFGYEDEESADTADVA